MILIIICITTYYVTIPVKLAKYCLKACNNNFFYPSTVFINEKNQKLITLYPNYIFEKKIKFLKEKGNKINILRIPKINTKHNLNILNEKIPNFREILFNK